MISEDIHFEGAHCSLLIKQPARNVIVIVFSGKDTNEFGDAPFQKLDASLQPGTELYIDARTAVSATIDVSGRWAKWLMRHKDDFTHVSMLTGSRFIQISADFVKRFAQMGDVMRLYTEAAAFDEALQTSIATWTVGL